MCVENNVLSLLMLSAILLVWNLYAIFFFWSSVLIIVIKIFTSQLYCMRERNAKQDEILALQEERYFDWSAADTSNDSPRFSGCCPFSRQLQGQVLHLCGTDRRRAWLSAPWHMKKSIWILASTAARPFVLSISSPARVAGANTLAKQLIL